MQDKLKAVTDQRPFVMIYHDFLESDKLDYFEKLIFIALKRFADHKTAIAFPSYQTLSDITGISVSKVRKCIDNMEKAGVLKVERRKDEKNNANKSNIYTLYDYAEIWNDKADEVAGEDKEDINLIIAKKTLEKAGYVVTKKESVTARANTDTDHDKCYTENDNTPAEKSQATGELFTLEEVKNMYEYNLLMNDYKHFEKDIDAVILLLYDTLNSTKNTIKIAGEEIDKDIVEKRLLTLSHAELVYVITKFHEQTDKVKNPRAYLLTMLYRSKEQMTFDYVNRINAGE